MLAILYKQGPSVPMIADWFDMRERIISDWFDRMEDEPIDEAIQDDQRPGRPPKLTDEQRATLLSALDDAPSEYWYDADEWTAAVAQAFLLDEFGVEYTRRHVQRLVKDGER